MNHEWLEMLECLFSQMIIKLQYRSSTLASNMPYVYR